jgi:imidazolonepropionase-like amidohydrolase
MLVRIDIVLLLIGYKNPYKMSSNAGGSPPAKRAKEAGNKLIIRNGRVLDPDQGLDGVMDIRVEDGLITAIGVGLEGGEDFEIVDATGLIVTAGLVDAHVHVYHAATPL